jgi:class 3 adenylate cyclase
MRQSRGSPDKAKPSVRRGRKAAGLLEKMAELPKGIDFWYVRLFLLGEGDKIKAIFQKLKFPEKLEIEFWEYYRVNTISATRLAFALGMFLYAVFGILDVVAMPLSRNAIWFIRYAIVCPIFGLIIGASYIPLFRKRMQLVIFLGALAAGLGIVAMIAVSRQAEIGYRFYISGLLLVVMWSYGFTRLRFWYATAANVLIIVAYEIVAVGPEQYLASQQGITMFLTYNYFFISANIIGMFTSYVLESYTRTDFMQKRFLEAEHDKSEKLLLNILPRKIATSLKEKGQIIADDFQETSVLFADIVNFTKLSTSLSPRTVVELLNSLFSHFDALADKYGVEKIKTIGDCYMVAAGVPGPCPSHAHVLASLALDMLEYVQEQRFLNGLHLELRVGINSGPLVAGIIGRRKFIYDLWGDTVNTASRMESHGSSGRIQISRSTYELLKEDFLCEAVGEIFVKGKGKMDVWYLLGKNPIRSISGDLIAHTALSHR